MVDRRTTPNRVCSLAVFAPSPALTVTVEHDADVPEVHVHAGGQGVWVSLLSARLGARVKLCAPLGGETGAVLRPLLEAEGIELLAVDVERASGAYVHDRRGGRRHVIAETPSPALLRHELDDLYGVALSAAVDSDLALLTGSRNAGVLPADTYRRLASDMKGAGNEVLADLGGKELLSAVRGGADLVKISEEELMAMGRLRTGDSDEVATEAGRLHREGGGDVLITRAERGAIALIGKQLLEVHGPRFAPLDPRGAGDSMFAALALALGSGQSIEDSLRFAAAAGSLNVTRHGLGTGHRNEIARLAQTASVQPLRLRVDSRASGSR